MSAIVSGARRRSHYRRKVDIQSGVKATSTCSLFVYSHISGKYLLIRINKKRSRSLSTVILSCHSAV